jgi:cell division protein FtsL
VSPVAVAAPPAPIRAGSRRGVALPAPRRAAQPRRDHLRVVAPARRARRVRYSVVFAAVATVVAVLALVMFHVMTAQSQLTLDHVSHQVDDAQRRYDQARLVNAQLASPSRIAARARQLGLVPPAAPPVPVPVPSGVTGTAVSVAAGHGSRP